MDTFERGFSPLRHKGHTDPRKKQRRTLGAGRQLPARTSAAARDALRAGKEREERERAPKDGGHHHMGYMWSADGARARAAKLAVRARQPGKALQRGDR